MSAVVYTKLVCDHCDRHIGPMEGAPDQTRDDRRKYTPNSPLWALDKDGKDVCWYCINDYVPWVHYVTGNVITGPFADNGQQREERVGQ